MRKLIMRAALIPILFSLAGLHGRKRRSTPEQLSTDGQASSQADTRSRIERARTLPRNSGPERDALNQQHENRSYDEDLPAGWYRDTNGRVHNDEGEFAPDPNVTDRDHNRETEYPTNFSQETHDRMAQEWTDQGRDLSDGRPTSIMRGDPPTAVPLSLDNRGAIVDPSGQRVPRSELTWRDDSDANNGLGNEIPYYDERGNTNLTYEHERSVVQHWVEEGHAQSYDDRKGWYNDLDNLKPMGRSENSSDGATLPWSYSDAAPDRDNGYTSKYD